MTDLRAAAHEHVERFGCGVIPCEGKRPLGRLVPRGLLMATTDHDQIDRWWRAEPQANIGLRTGDGFDALDIDDGWPTIARLVADHGPMTLGPVAVTPGGGAHYLFLPTGEGNRAGFRPGLDWRGRGGYIIGVGSVHPNGGRYEWAIPPDEAELCQAPPWLVDLLHKRASSPSVTPLIVSCGSAYARKALRDECRGVASAPKGTRNDRLNVASFNLATLIGAGLLDPDQAASALLAAAAQCGLPASEAARTIASGFRAGYAQPRGVAS